MQLLDEYILTILFIFNKKISKDALFQVLNLLFENFNYSPEDLNETELIKIDSEDISLTEEGVDYYLNHDFDSVDFNFVLDTLIDFKQKDAGFKKMELSGIPSYQKNLI